MKTKLVLIITLFPLWGLLGLYAQKTLIGVNTGNPSSTPPYYGNITQYDINGEIPLIVHEFDNVTGATPIGRLFLANNGKLYGTTSGGGNLIATTYGGVLFEYDLILNKYNALYYFDPDFSRFSQVGVLEPVLGQLVGATANRVFKYDLATGAMSFSNIVPYNNIYGDLIKASNGFIYGTSTGGYCSDTTSNLPLLGTIFKYDITSNTLTNVFIMTCGFSGIAAIPTSQLIEIAPGKLMGTTFNGGIYEGTNPGLNGGTIYEFDTNSNVFTKKIDFNYFVNGVHPLNLIDNGNGKVYGLCSEGGVPQTCNNPTFNFGTLYEYTPATNVLEVKRNFAYCGNSIAAPTSLLKTSLGTFIGTVPNGGLFKWNSETNLITLPSGGGAANTYNNSNLIEICRKPSYQEIIVNTFDACVGSTFSYDIHNTNATSYQWLKNGMDVPGQSSGILNLTALTTAEAGAYTCLMTNECGTTTTMPLNLTVNCLGTNTVANLNKTIKLYPNPTTKWLNIALPENIELTIILAKVTDMLGKEVLVSTSKNGKIDVSELSKGIYIISLQTNYGNWNGKFVKE